MLRRSCFFACKMRKGIGDCHRKSEENQKDEAPDMRVLFKSLASDDSRIGASLFQVNRDAYSPAEIFVAQCDLIYEWNGERYRMTDKIRKKDDAWGTWPYDARDAPPRPFDRR